MYKVFYGFSEKPFEITPDPKFLYLTSSHREALDTMMDGIKTRQDFISITGDAGTGKTTLIYYLLMNLNKKVKTAFIFNPSITFAELLEIILRELYLEVESKDKKSLIHQLVEYLSRTCNDETVAVIIDESQHLSKETLIDLEQLSRMELPASGRLQIVFVGQPDFEKILNSPGLSILNQRISSRRKIAALSAGESQSYIERRLNIAGSSTARIFTPEAVSVIIDYAKGIPRVINIVCDNALLNGFSESKRKIDAKIIRDVIQNMEAALLPKTKPMNALRLDNIKQLIHREKIIPQKIMGPVSLFMLGLLVIFFLMITFFLFRPSNISAIRSAWIAVFQREQPLLTISKTKNNMPSKADAYHSPDTKEIPPVEIARVTTPPSSSSTIVTKDARSEESITVREGQSISLLAKQHYGRSNMTRCDLILDFNPGITNANMISVNQKIRIPKLTGENMIVPSSDLTYKINVGTFKSAKSAEIYRREPLLQGKIIEIVARNAVPRETWYRVMVGKFNSEDEAIKMISLLKDKKLLPLFSADTRMQ